MKEKLSNLCHTQWSGWMKYLFSKCWVDCKLNTVIPIWAMERWQRQMDTPYENLSEEEQESDKKEADKFIKVIKEAGYKHKSEFEKLDEQKVFSLIEETLFLDGDRFGKSCICGKFDLTKAICAKFSNPEIKYPIKKENQRMSDASDFRLGQARGWNEAIDLTKKMNG